MLLANWTDLYAANNIPQDIYLPILDEIGAVLASKANSINGISLDAGSAI